MTARVVTVVDAMVDPSREEDLQTGYRKMIAAERPDGLERSELLRGQNGAWRIQTTWRDMDALMALRKTGARPAANDLLDRVGATHSHTWFTVEDALDAG